jgi:CHAT domain-containing protein
LGTEIEYSLDGKTWKPISLPATRLGVRYEFNFRKKVWLKSSIASKATLRVQKICNISQQEVQWRLELQDIAQGSDFSVRADGEKIRAWTTLLTARFAQSHSKTQQAHTSHVLANQFWLLGDLSESRRWFQIASGIWKDLAIDDLQFAAELGDFDLASRMGALTHSDYQKWQKKQFDGDVYFHLRAQQLGCWLELHAGNHGNAGRCFDALVEGYAKAGEIYDALNERITQVHLLAPEKSLQVRIDALQALAQKLPNTPGSHLYRGRFFLLLEYVFRQRGDFLQAMTANRQAKFEFERSPEESNAWVLESERTLAQTLTKLGLHEQALSLLKTTLEQVDAKASPARAVLVLDQLSQTLKKSGRIAEAIGNQEIALDLRIKLDLKADQAATRQRLQILDPKRPNYQLFAPSLAKTFYIDEQLLEVEMLRARQQFKKAQEKLLRINVNQLTNVHRTEYAKLSAQIALAVSLPEQARNKLHLHFEAQIEQLASLQSGALAYLELRQHSDLSGLWVDTLNLRNLEDKHLIQQAPLIWQFGLMQNANRQLTPSLIETTSRTSASDFTEWLSKAKLPPRISPATMPTLAQVQSTLPGDAAVLMLLPGHQQSLALWVFRDAVELRRLDGIKVLESTTLVLNNWIAEKGAAPKLNSILQTMGKLWPKRPVRKLWVVADQMTLAIPFSIILPDSTKTDEVSYITGLRTEKTLPPIGKRQQHFFAPNPKSLSASLEFIEREREMFTKQGALSFTANSATRENLQAALRNPGWTHIAAHGYANRHQFGFAGFNLAGEDAFFSWLELSQIHIRNELLVLNACDLASATQAGRQANVSFALAASSAGASHTIAALWPVSDAASATWVPAFYQALDGDANRAGAALFKAQRALAHSPHFRHPYYWASLVHFRQLLIEP